MYSLGKFLEGRTAIVTGAAQGNGKAIALELARLGANLAVTDIQEQAINKTAAEIQASGVKALPLVIDSSKPDQIHSLVEKTHAHFGAIDILVNNAGIIRLSTFPDINEADYDAIMDLNAKGAFFHIQAVAPKMRDGGKIINIASVAGVDGKTMSPPYAASKSALICMTKSLARTLAPRHITVNAVAPGLIETPFTDMLDEKVGVQARGLKPGELMAKIIETIPLGRKGLPHEVAGCVAFLASPGADYITGETLIISGGWVIN